MKAIATLALMIVCSPLLAEAQPAPPTPADQLKQLQGAWKVTWSIYSTKGQTDPQIASLVSQLAVHESTMEIKEQELLNAAHKPLAKLTNDPAAFSLDPAENDGYLSLVQLTLPEGKTVLCSYNFTEDGFTLRYPAGCCTRSGTVIHFAKADQ